MLMQRKSRGDYHLFVQIEIQQNAKKLASTGSATHGR